jgi:small conductance mechanosensitive channel
LIKILGLGGVAIGFAFQNILQNFLAGLLLLWAEPFRVRDEIKVDAFEGTVEEIQTRATIVKTYDGRQVVIPNVDLFTRCVGVSTAFNARRWEDDLTLKSVQGLGEFASATSQANKKRKGMILRRVMIALGCFFIKRRDLEPVPQCFDEFLLRSPAQKSCLFQTPHQPQ